MVGIVLNEYAVFSTFCKKIIEVLADLDYLIYRIFQFCFPRKSLTVHIPFPIALAFGLFGVFVEEDEAKARKQFLARKQKQESQQISSDKEKLRKAKERIAELDGLMQSVYEDKVSGEIPASMCAKLLTKYEAEQNALSAEVQEIEAKQLLQKQDEHDVDEYISRLKRFRNAEYLTRQMCLELIDSVTVDEFERGKQERDIHIYYKFIDKGYTGKSDD